MDCRDGYMLQGNDCVWLPRGCSKINANGLCIECWNTYELVFNSCILKIQYCLFYNLNGCTACINRYYLNNGRCWQNPIGCLSYDSNRNRCLTCITGYKLDQNMGICRASSSCLYYSSNN